MLFISGGCHVFEFVHCCLVVTCWERADLLALVCHVYCDFVTFPFGILGQVWYLFVSIPDPCCLSYFALLIMVGTVLPAKSDSDVMVGLQHYHELIIER